VKLTTRHLVHGTGRHRAPERVQIPEEVLLGAWPTPASHVPVALGTQCWGDCPHCGLATAGLLSKDGFTCGECLTTSPVQP
jgi:hypothetical protein